MPRASLGSILDEFHARWERGESPRAEDYLDLIDSREDAVELVYREYCLAEEAGLDPDPAGYVSRFSSLGSSLTRLFRLHDAFTVSQLQAWTERAPLPSEGDEIGPYFLMRTLGEGAFARVFLASQEDLENRLVVVKVSNGVTHEPRMLARLHHPNIVEIHWHGDVNDGELQLIEMPFAGGATLAAVLAELRRAGRRPRSGGDLLAALDRVSAPERPASAQPRAARQALGVPSFPRAVAWMVARLAEALDHAYDRGVAHGDVKPSNVLLTADGTPMLLDFNLAAGWQQHAVRATLDDPGGTLAYMAPERLRAIADQGHAGPARPSERHRADIYSLGIVLLEALSLRPPSLPRDRPDAPRDCARVLAEARMRGSDVLIRESRVSVPSTLRAILARCLGPDPSDRYNRAAALADDLDCWLRNQPLRYAEQPRFLPGAALWVRRQRVAVFVGVLTLATASATAYTKAFRDAARRRAQEHLTAYFDNSDSGIFRFRRYDLSRVIPHGDPAANAWRHLADWGVDQSDDWQKRDDFYYLSPPEQDELTAWLAEQALRYANAIRQRNPGPEHWNRALTAVDRMLRSVPAASLRRERERLSERVGRPCPTLSGGIRAVQGDWRHDYLEGVAAELGENDPRSEWKHFRNALERRPESFWAHYRAATVLFRLRDSGAAVEALQFCLELHPRNPALWSQLAGCLYQLERFDESLKACDEAIALDPSQAEAYLSRSFVRKRMGQESAQLEDVREFERLGRARGEASLGAGRFRGFPLPFGSKADLRLWQDDLPGRILRVDPLNLDARMALAYLLMYKGQVANAVAELDALLDIYPDYLAARYARENLRRRLGDRPGADADGIRFVNDRRVYEFLVDMPIGLRVFQRLAADQLRDEKVSEALAVARRGLTFAERLGEGRGECHYSLARCLAHAAASEPALLADSWRELWAVALSRRYVTLRDRFEIDSAFASSRRLLRGAFPPWVEPRQVNP